MGRALFLVVLSVVGCSLTTDLEPLRGGADGGGDGGPCSGAHILCEDFDEDGGWASSWVVQSNAATMEIAHDDFVSPPASLRIVAGAADARGVLLGTFPSAPTDFTCSVSMRVENFPSGYDSRIAPIFLYDIADPSLVDYELAFRGYDQTGSVDEHVETADGGWNDNDRALPYTVVDGAWHRVSIAVHLGASPKATLSLDGHAGVGASVALTPPSPVSGVAVGIGVSYAGSSGGWTAHFDDAVCDAD